MVREVTTPDLLLLYGWWYYSNTSVDELLRLVMDHRGRGRWIPDSSAISMYHGPNETIAYIDLRNAHKPQSQAAELKSKINKSTVQGNKIIVRHSV